MNQTTVPRRADRHQQKPSPLRDPRALLEWLPQHPQVQRQLQRLQRFQRPQRRPRPQPGPRGPYPYGSGPQPPAPLWKRVLKYWWVWLLPFAGLAAGAGVGLVYVFGQVPAPKDLPVAAATSTIEDAQGKVIGTLATEENRVIVPLSEISPHMQNAVLAAEDREFYNHGAVSYRGILRAAWANIVERRVAQGGSTLTQQYVKIAVIQNQERTILRKVNEVILAIKLEQELSKQKILENYLNTVYFGRRAYGVEAAAQAYFKVSAKDLNPQQAAFLAGVIQNPNFYDKEENVEAAKERRNTVLQIMGELGMLGPNETANWIDSNVDLKPPPSLGVASSSAPHFMEKVRLKLVEELGQARIDQGGLRVVTTLDPALQAAAVRAVEDEDIIQPGEDAPRVALTAIDPRSGAVVAMYGGASFAERQFNYATDAPRQAGSTMKPLVLATALDGGLNIRSRLDASACIVGLDQDPTKELCNFGKANYGEISLLESTVRSANTSFLRLIDRIGPEAVAQTATDCGFGAMLTQTGEDPANLPHVPSLALGAGEVNTLQLTTAYAAIANRGVYVEPYIVQQVVDSEGTELYRQRETTDSRRRCMSERTAATVSFALKEAVLQGTARNARIPVPAAGKTGSTNDNVDARFAGFTPDLAASVWMGYDDATRQLQNVQGLEQVTGGSLPAEVWQQFMTGALEADRLSGGDFPPPDLTSGTVVNPAPEDQGEGDGEDGGEDEGGEHGDGGEDGEGDGEHEGDEHGGDGGDHEDGDEHGGDGDGGGDGGDEHEGDGG